MAEDWRSWPRRQRVINQIDDFLRQTPEGNNKSAQELENSIFQKVTKEEDYLAYVTKIVKYLKEQIQTTNQGPSNLAAMLNAPQGSLRPQMSQGPGSSQMTPHNQGQMVHPGSQMNIGASASTSQMGQGATVNQGAGPSGMMQGTSGMIQGTMVGQPTRMQQPMIGNVSNQGDMMNWQPPAKSRRTNEMMMQNTKQGMVATKMTPIQMPLSVPNEQLNTGMNMGNQISRQGMMQARGTSPSFSMAGSSMPHPIQGGPSSTSASPVMQQQQQQHQQQLQNTLTFVSPSPSSNPVPSPAGSSGTGRNLNQLAASPGGMINTPGQPHSNSSMEDRAYTEKVKQLQSKYLDTLREVVQRFENSDSENARKVRNLLEVIENPQRRATKGMETLKACELVLERLGIQQRETRPEGAAAKPQNKDNPVVVLFDAINFALQSPMGAHTIHRTLAPALRTLTGPEIDIQIPPNILDLDEDEPYISPSDTTPIPPLIQGEIARLPPRFKLNLESQYFDDFILSCQLDDPNLPCLPPVILTVPPNYPSAPPRLRLPAFDFETTDYLKKVRQIMLDKELHLPHACSITMILIAFEMSVRRACQPKPYDSASEDPLSDIVLFK